MFLKLYGDCAKDITNTLLLSQKLNQEHQSEDDEQLTEVLEEKEPALGSDDEAIWANSEIQFRRLNRRTM